MAISPNQGKRRPVVSGSAGGLTGASIGVFLIQLNWVAYFLSVSLLDDKLALAYLPYFFLNSCIQLTTGVVLGSVIGLLAHGARAAFWFATGICSVVAMILFCFVAVLIQN